MLHVGGKCWRIRPSARGTRTWRELKRVSSYCRHQRRRPMGYRRSPPRYWRTLPEELRRTALNQLRSCCCTRQSTARLFQPPPTLSRCTPPTAASQTPLSTISPRAKTRCCTHGRWPSSNSSTWSRRCCFSRLVPCASGQTHGLLRGNRGCEPLPPLAHCGLRRTYSRLSAAGIPVVAIRGTPRTPFAVPTCLSRSAAQLMFARTYEYNREAAFRPAAVAAQTNAARGLDVRFVDMNDQICAGVRCGVMKNGVVIFTDDNHPTASFSRSLAPVLGVRSAQAAAELGTRLP